MKHHGAEDGADDEPGEGKGKGCIQGKGSLSRIRMGGNGDHISPRAAVPKEMLAKPPRPSQNPIRPPPPGRCRLISNSRAAMLAGLA